MKDEAADGGRSDRLDLAGSVSRRDDSRSFESSQQLSEKQRIAAGRSMARAAELLRGFRAQPLARQSTAADWLRGRGYIATAAGRAAICAQATVPSSTVGLWRASSQQHRDGKIPRSAAPDTPRTAVSRGSTHWQSSTDSSDWRVVGKIDHQPIQRVETPRIRVRSVERAPRGSNKRAAGPAAPANRSRHPRRSSDHGLQQLANDAKPERLFELRTPRLAA